MNRNFRCNFDLKNKKKNKYKNENNKKKNDEKNKNNIHPKRYLESIINILSQFNWLLYKKRYQDAST